MKKEDIIKIIAEEFDVREIEVMDYFDDIFESLSECFRKNKNVNISEFGKFFVRMKLNHDGVKERVVKFSPVKKLADDVNYNFNNLTKVRLRTLEERALDDIIKLSEADINLPEDLIIPETTEEPVETIIEEKTSQKEKIESESDEKKGAEVEEIETGLSEVESNVEGVHVEEKTDEKVEEKGFDVDTEMRDFLLEHIGSTLRKEDKLRKDEDKVEIVKEELAEEKDEAFSKDEFKEELDKITSERDKLVAEIDGLYSEKKGIEMEDEQKIPAEFDEIIERKEPLPIEKIEPEREEEKSIPQELDIDSGEEESKHIEDEVKDSEEIIIEETKIDKEEQPAKKGLDKVSDVDLSQHTEEVKKEIEEIFAERNKILSEIVELDLDKQEKEEESISEHLEETKLVEIEHKEENETLEEIESVKEDVVEESISVKDESDEHKDVEESISDKDELSKMIEERKKIIEEIESYKKKDFIKPPEEKDMEEPQSEDGEKPETKDETKTDDVIINDKTEISEETVVKSEESLSKQDEVSTERVEELRTEFNKEIETIKSGILYSKNIEKDVNKILDERKKILNNIANVELDVFDKLMEENLEKTDDTDINKDIESLSKMKIELGKTEFNPVIESTITSQVPVEEVAETNVEFKISSDVQKLHHEIVTDDSNIKEKENTRIADTEPKNYDDIFVQDEQKVPNNKNEDDKLDNIDDIQDNFDDVFK